MPFGEDITFSRHALNQMGERGINQNEIIETIRSPEYTSKQDTKRTRAVKRLRRNGKEYLLVVIYRSHPQGIKVVTVFITSKIHKYLYQ